LTTGETPLTPFTLLQNYRDTFLTDKLDYLTNFFDSVIIYCFEYDLVSDRLLSGCLLQLIIAEK